MSPDAATSDRPEKREPHSGRRFYVLLADDSSFGQAVGKQFLESLGCAVDVVASGEAAVTRACEHDYDIIFMDCQMPGMDGYEASRRIRLVPRLATVPIIALTGETTPEARQRCLDAGATDFVSKPYRPEMLNEMLQRLSKKAVPAIGARPGLAGEPPLFDRDEVWQRFGGDVELIREIVALITHDLPEYVEQVRRAVDAADWPTVARRAHTIKGTVGEVASTHLPEMAVSLEQAALATDRAAVVAMVPQIDRASSELLDALHAWEDHLTAGGNPHSGREH
jgi:CheY-like chemotaxis protein/HPt (histidine-containing phosphotransfer) domain-containing protein